MAKKSMKINVVDHLLLDNNREVEDVTSVVLPMLEHPTTAIDTSGIALAMDIPDMTKFNAAEYSIAHNNGTNSQYLAQPGLHTDEFRTVRQKYTTSKTKIEYESVKYRLTGIHKSTEKGTIETGNPWGSTDKYSLLRYEEIVDGKQTMLVDGPNNIIKINGKDYAGDVQKLLK